MSTYKNSLSEGLATGLIGAGGVAAWFLAIDALQGRPLFTPAALGTALFASGADMADVVISPSVVLGYSAVHVAAFVAVGIIAAFLARSAERTPSLLLGGVLFFVTLEAFFIGIIAILASWLLGVLAWWPIAVANMIAALLMGAHLWRAHPILRYGNLAGIEDPDFFVKQTP